LRTTVFPDWDGERLCRVRFFFAVRFFWLD
jgi:hypothetical protein